MSVCGIDFGNESNLVSLARKRGIDVILNAESKRETPCIAGYGARQRYVGVAGAAQLNTNVKNTITGVKRLIGRKFTDPVVQQEVPLLPFAVREAKDGSVEIAVQYMGQECILTPQQVIAALLQDLRKIAEDDQGGKVSDFVVSVPSYFNDAQRRAMLDACKIADINCLRLMNEDTATALAYGIFKTDLPEGKNPAVNVVFVDVGHSAMQVCVVAFKKGELKVLAHTWDENLGGRNFDQALIDHFAVEFNEKYKGLGDVRSSPKAVLRLQKEISKVKKVLSANPESPVNVECLANDIDVRGHITREKYEELAQATLDRVRTPCELAIEKSGLKVGEISSLEVVGSASRIPAIVKTLEDVFKRDVSRTMNASEAVCRGCALQCAMLSPVFKVRDFDVQDQFPFPVDLSWMKGGGDTPMADDDDKDKDAESAGADTGNTTGAQVFSKGNNVPSTKMLTFYRDEPFAIDAAYADDADIGAGQDKSIGSFTVGPFPAPAAGGKARIKVKVKLNLHSIVNVEGAQMLEEEEYEVPKEPEKKEDTKDDKDKKGKKDKGKDDKNEDAAAMETDEPAPVEMIKKKRIKRTDVPVSVVPAFALATTAVEEYAAVEKTMVAQDKLMFETAERKNQVEEYVYSMRDKLDGPYQDFVAPASKESFTSLLTGTEDWLYEDGEDESKQVYTAKLDELKAIGDPIVERFREAEARPAAAAALRAKISEFEALAATTDEKYAHIEAGDRETIVKECASASAWLTDKMSQQEATPKTDAPCVFAHEMTKKAETLERVCKPIMNKPKPAPPPPAAEEPKADAAATEGAEEKKDDAMDTDKAKADDLD